MSVRSEDEGDRLLAGNWTIEVGCAAARDDLAPRGAGELRHLAVVDSAAGVVARKPCSPGIDGIPVDNERLLQRMMRDSVPAARFTREHVLRHKSLRRAT